MITVCPLWENFVPDKPVCVDLDGTLVEGHTLFQIRPKFFFPQHFSWAGFKHSWAEHATIDTTSFTYYTPLEEKLRIWRASGIPLFLVTGAPEKIAHAVAKQCGYFSDVWCSSVHTNLVGTKKGDLLRQKFGVNGFVYAGNARPDWHVWKHTSLWLVRASSHSNLSQFLEKNKSENTQMIWF